MSQKHTVPPPHKKKNKNTKKQTKTWASVTTHTCKCTSSELSVGFYFSRITPKSRKKLGLVKFVHCHLDCNSLASHLLGRGCSVYLKSLDLMYVTGQNWNRAVIENVIILLKNVEWNSLAIQYSASPMRVLCSQFLLKLWYIFFLLDYKSISLYKSHKL